MSYESYLEEISKFYMKPDLSETLNSIPGEIYKNLATAKFDEYSFDIKADLLSEIFRIFTNNLKLDDISIYDIPYLFYTKDPLSSYIHQYLLDEIQEDIEEFIEKNYEPNQKGISQWDEHNHDFEADRMRGL